MDGSEKIGVARAGISVLNFVFFLSGIVLFHLFRFFPITSILLGFLAASFALAKKRYHLPLLLLLGAAYVFLRFSSPAGPSAAWNKELRLSGYFVPMVQPSAENRADLFRVKTAVDEETGEKIEELDGKEIGVFSDFDADPDKEYEVLLKSGRERARLNPGASRGGRLYGTAESVEEIGRAFFSVARFFQRKRALLNDYLLRRFGRDEAALVAAVTTGEKAYATAELREDFNTTGLAHLLSISGTHFGLFSVVMFSALVFLIERLPYRILVRLTVYLTPRQLAALLCLPFMVFYLGLSGGAPPAVRSFVMISLFLAGLLLGRRGAWLNSLLFAAFILALWDPDILFSFSFQMSFAAVLFIGFTAEKREDTEQRRLIRYAKKGLLISLVVSLGTAPLVAYHFHYFAVISPLANLIVSPLIGSLLVLLSLISSFFFFVTGRFIFAAPVSVVADLSVALVRALARVPFAQVKLPAFPPVLCLLFYAGFIPYFSFGRKKKLLLLPLAPFIIYAAIHAWEKKELSITFLDVGQGDSAVVEFPDGKVVVVDTGFSGKETAAFLEHEGIRIIDAIAVSHVHPDHSGGLWHLLESFRVGEIWDNGRIVYPPEMAAGPPRKTLSRGDIIETGGGTITVLHPYPEFTTSEDSGYGDENDSSLVLKVTGRKMSVLFAGDVQEEAEEDISQLGKWCRSDVLKVPHHGSKTSANEAFLFATSPHVAVISVGRENSFGHPSPVVIGKLSGIKVFRTDRDGAVKITETKEGMTVKTYRDFALQAADGPEAESLNIKRLFLKW